MRNLLYITPPDGIPEGETQKRDCPLIGFFAIKTVKGGFERALAIELLTEKQAWLFRLDGFLIASPNFDWREAAGFLGKANFVLGRRVEVSEYNRLIKERTSDKERGIDLSSAVDINSVEIPTF